MHSCVHQANVFVHFQPINHDEDNKKLREKNPHKRVTNKIASKKAIKIDRNLKNSKTGGHEQTNHIEDLDPSETSEKETYSFIHSFAKF
jgi:hypothetical protein